MTLQEMYINKNVYIDDMDCILVDYELFFDKELGKYNCFSVDDENELNQIREFCQRLIRLGTKIYVYAYSENVDSLGEYSCAMGSSAIIRFLFLYYWIYSIINVSKYIGDF